MNKKRCMLLSILAFSILISGFILAHGEEEEVEEVNLEEYYSGISIKLVLIASVIIIIVTILSIHYEKQLKNYKKILFLAIVIPSIIATLFLAGSTIYVNVISETKGPVHWHADFEIWDCGQKLDIKNPEGLSNREGTSTFHEHGDDRIHVEGVVIDFDSVDLHRFFKVIGGSINENELIIPTDDGIESVKNGDLCDDKPGKLQAFVYSVINPSESQLKYKQEKLEDFESYVLAPYSDIPPGDCIIIEFGEEKERTDKICETYRIAIEKGDLIGG